MDIRIQMLIVALNQVMGARKMTKIILSNYYEE